MLCIERSVQCCTLRPKVQDEAPVYGAYDKTTSPTVRNVGASLCCNALAMTPCVHKAACAKSCAEYAPPTVCFTVSLRPCVCFGLFYCLCYMYSCIDIHMCVYMYTYIYIERERDIDMY